MATTKHIHSCTTLPGERVVVKRENHHDNSDFAAFWLGVVGVMVTLQKTMEYYGEPLWLLPPGITACIFGGAVTLIVTSGRNIGTEPQEPAIHRSPDH